MIKCERCGSELGAGDNVRVYKKYGTGHTLINGKWEMTCNGGKIYAIEE